MRLALVTHYYPAHGGGIELVAAQLAGRLASGDAIAIAWHASDCDPPPAIAGVRCVPGHACNAIERRSGVPYPLWSLRGLKQVARAASTADVVHIHDCLYLPNLAAFAAARRAGRPVLVTQHVGLVPFRNRLLRALLSAAYRVLGRAVLGRATRVVFVSDSVRRYFADFVKFQAPPQLVENGVDTTQFHPVDEARRQALRSRWAVPVQAPLLVFVGRFVEKKGLRLLRGLAQRLSQARWLFAGAGPLDPAQWGLANVEVVRGRRGAALAELYQAADLLVLPSSGEGFPLVVQEAMACGTPALIASETAVGCPGAGALLLAEEVSGPDALERWERRLRELTAGKATLERLRPAVAAYAAEAWSWERCTERYAALLHQCIGQ
ncbi:MAG TPA: glycosyltransferase family 4 protein [Burkholderiales bacterium]|nr:glycosyltransferase family 4 protein [Burkholderiales bacterium]